MPRRNNRKKDTSKGDTNASMVTLLRQIQQNTSTAIAQPVPDTVVFPTLKRVRPYSVILAVNHFLVNSTTVPSFASWNIKLSDLTGYADYISAFDKYRILEVQVEALPNNGGLSTTNSALVHTVIDYDDDSSLTAGAALEYDSCYSCNSNQNFKRTFIPRSALAAYSGAFSSYAEARAGQWIDCASPNVQHYALKMEIQPSAPVFAMQLIFRVHVQFANQH